MRLDTLGPRPLIWGLSLVLLLAPLAPGLASSADMEAPGNSTLRDQSVPLPANTTQGLDARDAPDTTNATNTTDRPHLDADLNTTRSDHELIELPGADGPCTDDPNVVNECGDEMNGTLDMGDNDIVFDGGRVWFENGALDGAGDGGGLRFGGDRVCTAFATVAGCESPGSDIDAVHTGFGLGGGGDAGAVTLFVDSSQVQVRVEGACGEGAMVTAIHADGQVSCALDQGRQFFAGNGLVLEDSTFRVAPCGTGEVLKAQGDGLWACDDDLDTDTTYDGSDFALSDQLCQAGEIVQGITTAGAIVCATDQANPGDITAVLAGDGLAGGGDAGDVTLSIAPGSITSDQLAPDAIAGEHVQDSALRGAHIVDGSIGQADLAFVPGDVTAISAGDGLLGGGAEGDLALAVDPASFQRRVSAACPEGSSIRSINQDGTIVCEVDRDTDALGELVCADEAITRFNGSSWICSTDQVGITEESDPTVNALAQASLACESGQVAKLNGTVWGCAEDVDTVDPNTDTLGDLDCADGEIARRLIFDTPDGSALFWRCSTDGDTTYTAGDGLALSGTEFSISPCSSGQILRYDGFSWTCAEDRDTLAGLGCSEDQIAQVDFGIPPGAGETVPQPFWACADPETAVNAWLLGGNAGTLAGTNFLGTTDHEALEFRVNNSTVMRYEPGTAESINGPEAPNLIGGSHANSVASGVKGATISGGGTHDDGSGADIVQANRVTDDFSTIGGGWNNLAGNENGDPGDADFATVSGGAANWAEATMATVAGGGGNDATGSFAAVGGGVTNHATGNSATISGGRENTVGAHHGAIGGGGENEVAGSAPYATIGGGGPSTTSENQNGEALIVEHAANSVDATHGTIAGGSGNTVTGAFGAIPGGLQNNAGGATSLAAGKAANASHRGSFVWSDSSIAEFTSTGVDQFLVEADGGVGINTNAPEAALHVSGDARIEGTVRMGDESVGATPPHGTLTRQVITRTSSAGSPVAATDLLSLERDGTNGGFQIRTVDTIPSSGHQTVACTGITETGAAANAYVDIPGGTASGTIFTVYDDSESVHKLDCSFGNPWGGGGEHYTDVELTRRTNDFWWMGTVTTTFSQ